MGAYRGVCIPHILKNIPETFLELSILLENSEKKGLNFNLEARSQKDKYYVLSKGDRASKGQKNAKKGHF
jgi:hypothetical protein